VKPGVAPTPTALLLFKELMRELLPTLGYPEEDLMNGI
jgi:hypothetical protein